MCSIENLNTEPFFAQSSDKNILHKNNEVLLKRSITGQAQAQVQVLSPKYKAKVSKQRPQRLKVQ